MCIKLSKSTLNLQKLNSSEIWKLHSSTPLFFTFLWCYSYTYYVHVCHTLNSASLKYDFVSYSVFRTLTEGKDKHTRVVLVFSSCFLRLPSSFCLRPPPPSHSKLFIFDSFLSLNSSCPQVSFLYSSSFHDVLFLGNIFIFSGKETID